MIAIQSSKRCPDRVRSAVDDLPTIGEFPTIDERLVVAPSAGRFAPSLTKPGAVVEIGESIGLVESRDARCVVGSPFRGSLLGLLVVRGERVRKGQPVARLRVQPPTMQ